MTGVDTNILVALALPNHPHHKRVFQAAWKEHQGDTRFVLTSAVAGEFLHVATDTKRLEPALTMSEAFHWLNQWGDATNAEYITDNEAARALWFE